MMCLADETQVLVGDFLCSARSLPGAGFPDLQQRQINNV